MPIADQLDPEVLEEFDRLASLPPEARFARAEELLRQAEASNSFAQEFVARQTIASASYYVPNDPRHLVHFAWLRQAIETHPELDDGDREGVLWVLKWAVNLTWGMPQVPLADIARMIDDLERVYRAHGFSVRPATHARAKLARARGDHLTAAALVREWLAAPRDGMSDCEACERHGQAELMVPTDPEWAMSRLAPVLDREFTCASQPLEATALAASLRASSGDLSEAADLALDAWRAGKDRRDLPCTVASILTTFARIGNVDRALAGLMPRLGWIDDLSHDHDTMDYAGAAALVLEVAQASGLAPAEVGGRPVAVVADELRQTATRLAASFDHRNGSTVESDRLRDTWDLTRMAQTPTLPVLLVAEPGASSADAVEDTRSIAERAAELRRLLDETSMHVEDEAVAWLRDREQLLAAETADDAVLVAFLDRVTSRALAPEEQLTRLQESLSRAESVGDTIEARRARAALLQLDVDPDDESTFAPIVAIAESLESDGHLDHAAAVWLGMAHSARIEAKAELALRSADCSSRDGDLVREALALCEAARAVLIVGVDTAQAEELLARAESLAPRHTGVRATTSSLRCRSAASRGDHEGAIIIVRQGLELPDLGRQEAVLRIDLCDLLVDSHRYDEVATESGHLLTMATELRDPALLAMAQRYRGLALVELGEFVEASELLESALPVIRERVPWLTGPAGWALGNALVGLSELGGARTAFATAALGFEAEGRPQEQAHAQYRAGMAAWDVGDHEAARAHLGEALELARRHHVVPVFQSAARDLAALRCQQGEVDLGIEALDRVPEEAEQLALEAGLDPTLEMTADLRRDVLRQGAHLLAELGDFAEALARLRRAEVEADDPDELLVLRALQGQFLASAGQLDEAVALLQPSLPRMSDEHLKGWRIQAAGGWATALDQAGRTDEADRVWEEFGPDA